jgi:two-component system nitrate/nitrite sensor histidine kinase NarX
MSQPSLSLSVKLAIAGALLALMALASVGMTLWVSWQLQGGAAAINEAGRLRMQIWRLAQTLSSHHGPATLLDRYESQAGQDTLAQALVSPVPDEEARLREYLQQFDATLALLDRGDPARPLVVPHDRRTRAALVQVQQGWQDLRSDWSGATAPALLAQQAGDFVARIEALVTAIELRMEGWATLLATGQLFIALMVGAAAVVLLYAAYTFVLAPLARLQHGVAQIRGGDFSARLDTGRNDEFGALAADFNLMAQTLQSFYSELEARVQEKTRGLETERRRLAVLHEAAAFVLKTSSMDELTQGFARQARAAAQADAAAVRWFDETSQCYLLLASDSMPGDLVEAVRCVPAANCPCRQQTGEARMRVIPIANSVAKSGPCARAGFDTAVNVPVRVHDREVGLIELFYRAPPALGEDDHSLLDTLASYLVGAIEGLRAGALEREAAVAEERAMLARELHDSIAQSLSFLKIQAGLLREALQRNDEPSIARTLAEFDAGIHESLADVRELLLHFRTRTNADDIAQALRSALTKFEHQTGLPAHLSLKGAGLPLPPDVQVQVLHIVQEVLSNVRKHARASQVWVEVRQSPPWSVEVRDDGVGFDTTQRLADDEAHVGLRIMRERAAHIGASVEIVSVPDCGTCVTLELPVRAPPQEA